MTLPVRDQLEQYARTLGIPPTELWELTVREFAERIELHRNMARAVESVPWQVRP